MEWNAHQSDRVPKASQEWRREILEMREIFIKLGTVGPSLTHHPEIQKNMFLSNREASVCIRPDLERRATVGRGVA